MSKSKHSKKVFFILTAVIMIIVAIIGLIFRDKYVYLEGNFVERKTESIDVYLDKVNIKELNRCSNIKSMIVSGATNERFSQLAISEHLESLEVFHSKEKISVDGIAIINKQPNLKNIGFTYAEVDLNGIKSSSIEKMILSSSSVKNIQSIDDCVALKELILNNSKADNCIIPEESCVDNESFNLCLRDSSEFSCLNNIEVITLHNIRIEDISGFIKMKSLKKLNVSVGSISESNRAVLEEKGISVTDISNNN